MTRKRKQNKAQAVAPYLREKTCTDCGETKWLSEFPRSVAMKDGHMHRCSECNKRYCRERYAKKTEWYTSREAKVPRFVRRARQALSSAVRSGRLVRLPCTVCLSGKAEGHHDDYSKPLEVVWLCKEHHRQRHVYLTEAGLDPKMLYLRDHPEEAGT